MGTWIQQPTSAQSRRSWRNKRCSSRKAMLRRWARFSLFGKQKMMLPGPREERSTPESGRQMQGEPLPRALGVPLVCRLEGERGQSRSARAKVSRFLLWRESGMWENGLGGQGRVWQESHWIAEEATNWPKNIQQDQAKCKVQTETCFLLLLWPFCPGQNNQTTLQELKDDTKLQEVRDSTGLGKSQTAEVAWLDRLRIPYEEHDVGDFYRFIQQHQNNNRWCLRHPSFRSDAYKGHAGKKQFQKECWGWKCEPQSDDSHSSFILQEPHKVIGWQEFMQA